MPNLRGCATKGRGSSFARVYLAIMASPGVYLFRRKGRQTYVGRGDRDVLARMKILFRQADYALMVTVYETTSARQAYLLECRLFQRHRPCEITKFILPCVPTPNGGV